MVKRTNKQQPAAAAAEGGAIAKKKASPPPLPESIKFDTYIARVHKQMRKSAVADQISSKAPLYVAAAIEKVLSTILEQATDNVRNGQRTQKGELKSKRVINGDIIAVVRSNPRAW